MTLEQKIADIRRVCIEANPEIVELKFGCLVQRMTDPAILDVVLEIKTGVHYPHHVTLMRPSVVGLFSWECNTKEVESWVIIGREIQLADIFLAMERKDGDFYIINCWNLTKPLSDQSPETVDFIHQLIEKV